MVTSTAPVVLVILDGWGIAPPGPGNAITLAQPKTFTQLWETFPHTRLKAAGRAVGLPDGADGNSEVGHLSLGAGRIFLQDVARVNLLQNTLLKKDLMLPVLTAVKHK